MLNNKLNQILLNQIIIMTILLANDGKSVFAISDANADAVKKAINISGDLIMDKG